MITRSCLATLALSALSGCVLEATPADAGGPTSTEMVLQSLVIPAGATLSADVTNRFADDPRAAALGQMLFFDKRFSGPLLDDANDGTPGTLGSQGEPQKVACASCHVPTKGAFADLRSPRHQLSLGAAWTHRKAPSLLNVAQMGLLMWDGRRDSAFSQVFSPIESPIEFNSSRLFVAQQVAVHYRAQYEDLFGALPAGLSAYAALDPAQAGCAQLPADAVHERCTKPGHDDAAVVTVVTNFGKAVQAFTRKLSCGRGRFDAWVEGDAAALTPDEQAGALLFIGKGGCTGCHSGPYFTDRQFHNLGLGGEVSVPFTGVSTANDPGASVAMAELLNDPLSSRGAFSDGDDGRLDALPKDLSTLTGAFHTAGLRCVSRRPSFMHNARYRSLEDVVDFFSTGASVDGYVGTAENYPRRFTETEKAQLVAFLKALEGEGPDAQWLTPPALP